MWSRYQRSVFTAGPGCVALDDAVEVRPAAHGAQGAEQREDQNDRYAERLIQVESKG